VLELRARPDDCRQLSLGDFQNRLGLDDVEIGDEAAGAALPRQFKGLAVGFNTPAQRRLFRIKRADGEIIHRNFGGDCEPCTLEVGRTGLLPGEGGFGLTARAAPEIDLVAEVEGHGEIVVGVSPARRRPCGAERSVG
jgi:hypothetical protein